ncbi:hypothetical protein [Catellatospora sp. TT07R-123]|uniref:hypothetical protein n=1 Tax=Catellatospora sp. TT07R-123 TaxID=2733863 RepID=UPI001BB3F036|nr:hypothetical protein [Catellatospora sp. TT07R-123]
MSDTDEQPPSWRYAHTDTLDGALQRGRGIGALMALRDPAAPEAVYACIRRDHRWDQQVDDRADYLARLVRDLDLDLTPIADQLYEPVDPDVDPDNTFQLGADVLTALGRGGDQSAVAVLRAYLAEGTCWSSVLSRIESQWPADDWDDLDAVCVARLSEQDEDEFAFSCPLALARWAPRQPRLAGILRRHEQRGPHARSAIPDRSSDELVTVLADPDVPRHRKLTALRELERLGKPEPRLLDLIDAGLDLPLLARSLRRLGAAAVDRARGWTPDLGAQRYWFGNLVLARHGTAADLPRLLEAWNWLRDRPDDWCGFDRLADGFARFGTAAAEAMPGLTGVWRWTPHSYERAAVLRAMLAVDPVRAQRALGPALLDCEVGTREVAAAAAARDRQPGVVVPGR